jgi:hypothetical protein
MVYPRRKTKSPLNAFRVSGPELLNIAGYINSAISGAHRRPRALRVMVMAMMETRQHALVRLWEGIAPGQSVKSPSGSIFRIKPIQILHARLEHLTHS